MLVVLHVPDCFNELMFTRSLSVGGDINVVFTLGLMGVISIDSVTFVLISCHDYDAQTDAQLA